MQIYSIVFSDIDGTLLNSRGQVTPATRAALSQLQKQGVPIVLCSARPPAGVRKVAALAGIRGPMICYSGSLALDEDGALLSQAGIPGELALRFKAFAREGFPQVETSAYHLEDWLVDDPSTAYVAAETAATNCVPILGKIEPESWVHKLLCIGPPEEIARLGERAAQAFPELCFVQSAATYLEVLLQGVSKATGAKGILEQLGLPAQCSVAFGDYFADVPLLQYAGLGVAIGNAPKEVQQAADRVTGTNDEEGLCRMLKELRFTAPSGKTPLPGLGSV